MRHQRVAFSGFSPRVWLSFMMTSTRQPRVMSSASRSSLRTRSSSIRGAARSLGRGFIEYFEQFLYPYYREHDPTLTREHFVEEASLEYIEPFLAHTDSVGVVTNADDVILAPGDLDFLKKTFAGRMTIFPTGGHLGNMQDPHVIAAAVRFLAP